MTAAAAAIFASAGESSLPRKKTRMFLNSSGQNGMTGVAASVAVATGRDAQNGRPGWTVHHTYVSGCLCVSGAVALPVGCCVRTRQSWVRADALYKNEVADGVVEWTMTEDTAGPSARREPGGWRKCVDRAIGTTRSLRPPARADRRRARAHPRRSDHDSRWLVPASPYYAARMRCLTQ